MSKKDYPKPQQNDSWHTDKWILDMFPISPSYVVCARFADLWFDPCPYIENFDANEHRDGLKIDWLPRTFVNPPYSNPLPWVEKAIDENKKGHIIVMLLIHDTSTRWYAKLHEAGARFMSIQGRLKYGSGKACAFPSVLVTLESTLTE